MIATIMTEEMTNLKFKKHNENRKHKTFSFPRHLENRNSL